ncbi:MAG: thiamine phosphate synthase [Wolbachia sp.]|nr:thiamine phosphate synthase [Wolbachia sp.]MDD9336695.1 thiamine phosphate synthase [Wolbachia sp.]
MLITQLYNTNIDSYLEFIKKCAKGGITSLQFHEKHDSLEFLFKFRCRLKSISAPFNVPLVNDDVDLSCKLGTDGN